MLTKIADHFSEFAGVTFQHHVGRNLPWEPTGSELAETIARLRLMLGAYPGVSLVGDVGVSYLPRVSDIARAIPNSSFPCITLPCEELVREYLQAFASHPVLEPGRESLVPRPVWPR